MLDADKYTRSVTLICPTCGGTQFEFESPPTDETLVKCNTCKREFTKSELIELNSESISEGVKEMGQDVLKDIRDEMKRAFSGSKTFKIG